jgi:hypothetical protein
MAMVWIWGGAIPEGHMAGKVFNMAGWALILPNLEI